MTEKQTDQIKEVTNEIFNELRGCALPVDTYDRIYNVLKRYVQPSPPDKDMVEKIAEELYCDDYGKDALIPWNKLDKDYTGHVMPYPRAELYYDRATRICTIIQPALQAAENKGRKEGFLSLITEKEKQVIERQKQLEIEYPTKSLPEKS